MTTSSTPATAPSTQASSRPRKQRANAVTPATDTASASGVTRAPVSPEMTAASTPATASTSAPAASATPSTTAASASAPAKAGTAKSKTSKAKSVEDKTSSAKRTAKPGKGVKTAKGTPTATIATATTTETAPADKEKKPKKPKLVRDSFTIPKDEYAAIDLLKARALTQGVAIKKSELLRAGLLALTAQSDAALLKTIQSVPAIKTGRPRKN